MTVKNYVLDINKTSLQHPSIVLRQDDYNIYTVNISVTENGTPVNLGSYTLNFLGITPAGAKIIDSKNFITNAGDLAIGKFSYRFPKEASGSKGVYDVAYFRLKTTSGATSTIDLNLRVLGGIDLTADEVKDYITVDDTLRNTLVSEVFKKVDAKVDEHLATVKKGDKGDTGPAGKDGYMPVIGGRNLLLGTGDWSGGSAVWDQRDTLKSGTYRGMVVATTSSAWKSPAYIIQNAGILQVGKTYTFSTYVRNTSDTDTTVVSYYDGEIVTPYGVTTALPAHTDWTRVSVTFKVIKDPTTSTQAIRWESQKPLTNGQIQFAGYKLEEGNVPTDWTPAPEDIDNRYVQKSGDTMTGTLTAPQLTATDSINGFLTAIRVPDTTTKIIDLINNDFIKGKDFWKEATFIAYNRSFSDAPTNDAYSIVKLATRGSNRTYVEYSDLSGNVWRTTATTNTLNSWVKQADNSTVVHNTGNETVAGNKTLTGLTTMLIGNYGLRVTSSGFQKTTDGGTTWVTAQI